MKIPIHYDYIRNSQIAPLYDAVRETLAPLDATAIAAGMTNPAYERLAIQALSPSARAVMHAMACWERQGQQAYVVGPQVGAALASTDLTGIRSDCIGDMAADCVYVALRDSDVKIFGGSTGWHRLSGMYLMRTLRCIDKKIRPALSLVLWGAPNERASGPLDDAVFWFSLPVDDGKHDLEQIYGDGPVFPSVEECEADVFGWEELTLSSAAGPEDRKMIAEYLRQAFRLAMNLIVYLASQDADVELDRTTEERRVELETKRDRCRKPGKLKRFERQIAALPQHVVRYVGAKLEHELGATTPGGASGGTRAAPRRHVVRPHWRSYWVGSGDERRKVRRWIAPFVRGSGDPERTVTIVRETVAECRA